MELHVAGREWSGAEAAAVGLVNQAFPPEELEARVLEICLRIAQTPVSTCQHILDQLSMINLGGKADVTAGIEILERLSELLAAEPES